MRDIRLRIDTNTFVRFWLVVIAFTLAIAALWIGRDALMLIFVAFFLSLVLNRPVSYIAKFMPGKSRIGGTLVSYLLILAVIAFVCITVLPFFVQQIANFISTLPATVESLQHNAHFVTDFVKDQGMESQYNEFVNNLQSSLGAFASEIGSSFISLASGFLNGLTNFLLIIVLTFLMLTEGPRWSERFWRLIYKEGDRRRRHQELTTKMYNVVSGYVTGQVLVAAVAAIATGLGVVALSFFFPVPINVALPAASIIFLTAFIPMFGATIGGVIAALLLLLYSFPAAIVFGIYFIVYQQIENNYVSPKIQSKKLNMSALAVLLSATIGIKIGGILGAFVAIPIGGCIMIIAQDYLSRRKERSASTDSVDTAKSTIAAAIEAEREAHQDIVADKSKRKAARKDKNRK